MNYEIIGTTASIIVVLSFLTKSEKSIRIINVIGSLIFILYGILINSFSIIILNSMLILINFYKLIIK